MPLFVCFVCLFVFFFISVMKSLKMATFNHVRDKSGQQNNAHQYGDEQWCLNSHVRKITHWSRTWSYHLSFRWNPTFSVRSQWISLATLPCLFIFFLTLFWTRTYDMADGLVVLFAHSTFVIGLCPVDCCFYINCSYCLILCCNNKRWHCFSFKSDGQEISTIEWQELKNRFPSFFAHKQLLGR